MRTTTSMSDRDTRTMTPDQMNVEALLQSREYFGQSYGSQSDVGSTTEFGHQMSRTWDQSCRLTQTLEESTEFSQSKMTTQSESELRITERYPDSLEGTLDYGTLDQSEGQIEMLGHTGTLGNTDTIGHTETLGGTGSLEEAAKPIGTSTSMTDQRIIARPPLTVSVTIPSMEQTESSGDESIEDVSELT